MVGDGPHYVGGSGGGGGGHVAVSLYGRSWAALLRVYWRRRRRPGINRAPPAQTLVRDTGIEPVTSSVSGKRSPAELIAPVANSEVETGIEPVCMALQAVASPLGHSTAGIDATCTF